MTQAIALRPLQNHLVLIENGHATTTTQIVADAFGKLHKDVLRAVRNLECSEDFNRRNFAPVAYIDDKGEARTMYSLTRDGAMYLIMGFTGAKAAAMREAFIAEFGRMEGELKAKSDRRAEKAERETLRLLRELRLRDRQVIQYARKESKALKAQSVAMHRTPAVDPRQQPLDFDLSGMADLPTLDLDLSRGLEG